MHEIDEKVINQSKESHKRVKDSIQTEESSITHNIVKKIIKSFIVLHQKINPIFSKRREKIEKIVDQMLNNKINILVMIEIDILWTKDNVKKLKSIFKKIFGSIGVYIHNIDSDRIEGM